MTGFGALSIVILVFFFTACDYFSLPVFILGFTTTPSHTNWIESRRAAAATLDEPPVTSSNAASKKQSLSLGKSHGHGLSDEEEAILFGSDNVDPSFPPYPAQHRQKDKFGNVLPDRTVRLNPLDRSVNDPRINKLHTIRGVVQSCPEIWLQLEAVCPDLRALLDEHLCDTRMDLTFSEMSLLVQKSASVFSSLGVQSGVNVAIFGENSAVWLLVDHGIQLAGGASAVRGADAPVDELCYIYQHSDSASVVVLQGPRLLSKLAKNAASKKYKERQNKSLLDLWNEKHGAVRTVILMHREKRSEEEIDQLSSQLFGGEIKVVFFSKLLDAAMPLSASERPVLTRNDLATIVYTSGTTGQPKGVMLTHGNLLHQTGHRLAPSLPYEDAEPLPGESMVSLLPVWHITERSFELWMASRGCAVIYSSIRTFRNDLTKYQPEWMVLVPRVLEKIALGVQDKFNSGGIIVRTLTKIFTSSSQFAAKHRKIANGLVVSDEEPDGLQRLLSKLQLVLVYPMNAIGDKLIWKKVRAGFGGNLKVIISGGSSLAGSLEKFYEAAGVNLCVGYGLTECSPLISYRRSDCNLVFAGCAGKPCLDTELRIVDPESKQMPRSPLPVGQVGVVIARGPQIMSGYFKNPEATALAIDVAGWFDTGDLGRINPATGDLILTGRAKDTIVLSNGENVEPSPIEDAILGECNLVEQVMLTGQDGRKLIAIVVLNPNALVEAGFLDRDQMHQLQKANEKVNDPACNEVECVPYCHLLQDASVAMRKNVDLQRSLHADVIRATSRFRKWEQVGSVYVTLEPFAMVNGLLTQSYKIKRLAVLNRYEESLQQLAQ